MNVQVAMRLLVAKSPSLPVGALAVNTRARAYNAAASLTGLSARSVITATAGAS